MLSADFARLEDEIYDVQQAGATRLHLDIMDGHFVQNITFGPIIVKAIRKLSTCLLDCHLMILSPEAYLDPFIEAGADTVILHVEIPGPLKSSLIRIRDLGCQAGISLNPETDIRKIKPYLDIVDHVLVMSVHPGFGGQTFIPDALAKIEYLATHRSDRNFIISVDGGINLTTIASVFTSGADMAVVGDGLFSAADRKHRYLELMNV